ncbi:hypothetical protein CLV78_101474 [Aliiruegeria haliotis]|uniref:Uncharacterized protein n=1 Tax=Aliiruegeria haliotis TaxID=1280846 RepID=A0A2T0RYW5_9RHOB|nr:hypothetical protein CLV78_101474 [Aliiruegeria haliotis]
MAVHPIYDLRGDQCWRERGELTERDLIESRIRSRTKWATRLRRLKLRAAVFGRSGRGMTDGFRRINRHRPPTGSRRT